MKYILCMMICLNAWVAQGYNSYEARSPDSLSAEDWELAKRRLPEVVPEGATEGHKLTILRACGRIEGDWEYFKRIIKSIVRDGMPVWQQAFSIEEVASIHFLKWPELENQLDYFGLPLLESVKRFGLVTILARITPNYWPLVDYLKPYTKTQQEGHHMIETLYYTFGFMFKAPPERIAFRNKMMELEPQKLPVMEWIVRARNQVKEANVQETAFP